MFTLNYSKRNMIFQLIQKSIFEPNSWERLFNMSKTFPKISHSNSHLCFMHLFPVPYPPQIALSIDARSIYNPPNSLQYPGAQEMEGQRAESPASSSSSHSDASSTTSVQLDPDFDENKFNKKFEEPQLPQPQQPQSPPIAQKQQQKSSPTSPKLQQQQSQPLPKTDFVSTPQDLFSGLFFPFV